MVSRFYTTKSKPLNYVTIQPLHQGRRFQHIVPKFKFVVSKYVTRGYRITDICTDNEFDSNEYSQVLLLANLHICAQGEHVPIIERSIRTINERVRATLQGLPYMALPRLMYVSLLERVERTLNNFPPPSEPYSLPPITLVEGKSQFDAKKLVSPFGTPHTFILVATIPWRQELH